MKHLMKRAFVLLLSASIVFSSVPVQHVHAEEAESVVSIAEEGLIAEESATFATTRALAEWSYYKQSDGTICLTGYKLNGGSDVELVIPDTVDGYTVSGMDSSLFRNKTFSTVTLPKNLKSEWPVMLFESSVIIDKVIVPAGYTSTDQWFNGASGINEIEFQGNTITTIPMNSFQGATSLKKVSGLDNVVTVGMYAFNGCSSLESIAFTDKLQSIDTNAFSSCSNLETAELGGNITVLGDSAFAFCTELTSVTGIENVTEIKNQVFNGCNKLVNVTIPGGIQSLGINSFTNTAITEVILPSSLTVMGQGAFYNCPQLTKVAIQDGAIKIPMNMFGNCSLLSEVTIPKSVNSIDPSTFSNCDSLTIYGYTGSYAETYAEEYNITFEPIGTVEEEQLGVFLSNAEMLTDTAGITNVIRGGGSLHVNARMGDGVEFTKWEFIYTAPDGEITHIDKKVHYYIDETTNELVVPDTSDFSEKGIFKITACGKTADGTDVSYSKEFKITSIELTFSHDYVEIYDGSEVTLSVASIYDDEDVTYSWEAGAFNDNGEFEWKVQFTTSESSIKLTKDVLKNAWGSNPENGAKTYIHVCLFKGEEVIKDASVEVVYCEDYMEFPVGNFVTLKDSSSWWFSKNQSIYVKNAKYPEGQSLLITIVSMTSDTMSFPYDEDDGEFKFSYVNASADSGIITIKYTMLEEDGTLVEKTYDTPYEFKDAIYGLRTVVTGASEWMVKGQTKNIKPVVYKEWSVKGEDGDYETYYGEVKIEGSLTAEWTYDKEEAAKYVTIQENSDGSITVKAINAVDSEVHIPLHLVIKDGGEVVQSSEEEIALTTEYDEFFVYNVSSGKPFTKENIKIGETVTIRPVVMKFTNTTPDGIDQKVEFNAPKVDEDDKSDFEIIDNKNGTYTVKRVTKDSFALNFEGQLLGGHIDETFYFDDLWPEIECFINENDEDIVLFTDDKVKVTASTEEVATDVVWDWDIVAYGGYGSSDDEELYRIDIARGKDLRSVELDGSKYVEYLEDRRVDDFKIEIRLFVDEKLAVTSGKYIEYKKSYVETPIEGVWEELLTTVCGIEKNYQGRIETKDYPSGISAQLQIRNLQLLSGDDVVSLEEVYDCYFFTIKNEGTAVISYDVYYNNKPVKEDVVLEIKGAKEIYRGNIVSDKSDNGSSLIFKNESITFSAEYYLDCYSEEGYFYKEKVENLKLAVADTYYSCNEDDCDGTCGVTITENSDGTVTYDPNGHDCNVELELDVYAGDVKIDTVTEWAYVAIEDYRIVVENAAKIKDLKQGESVEVRPVLKRFSEDVLDGTVIDTSEFDFSWEYDKDNFEITSKEEDGITVWTIKRISSYATSLYCEYVDSKYNETIAGWIEVFDCGHGRTAHINGKDSTCLEAGYSGAKVCEDCEYLVEASSPIEKKAHQMTHHKAVEATCEDFGNVEYWYCSLCQKNYNAEQEGTLITDVVVAKKAHQMTHHEAVEATCTEEGTVEYWHCSACDKNYDKEVDGKVIVDVVVGKKAHKMTYYAAKTATCREEGNVEYWLCETCDTNYDAEADGKVIADVVVGKKAHKMTYYAAKTATCTEEGNVEYWACGTCDTNYDAKENGNIIVDVVIAKKAHEMTHHEAVEATCTEEGTVEYWYCSSCDKNYDKEVDGKVLADIVAGKKPHSMTYHEAVEATCTEEGTVEYWYCSTCDKNYDAEADGNVIADVVVAKKLHKMTHHKAVEATCEDFGNVEYWYCSSCQKNYNAEQEGTPVANVLVVKNEHEMEHHEAVASTCTDTGNKAYYLCSICENKFVDEVGKEVLNIVEIPATGHQLKKVEAKAATCEDFGNVEYYCCSTCNKNFADVDGKEELTNVQIPKTAHKLSKTKAKAATCEKDGNIEYYTCSICKSKFADAAGNNELKNSIVIQSPGHQMTKTEAKAATCTENGNKEYYTCSVCEKAFADVAGNTEIKDIVITAKGHKLTEKASTAASCTGTGNVKYHHCSECDKNFADLAGEKELVNVETNATGHKLNKVEAKAATCTETGNAEYYHCDTCKKNFADENAVTEVTNVMISSLGHGIMTRTDAKAATCEATGNVEYYTCSVCYKNFADAAGDVVLDTVVIPVTHAMKKVNEVKATCESDGVAAHYHCNVCGKNFEDAKGNKELTTIVIAKDHGVMKRTKAAAATCTTAGNVEYYTCTVCNKKYSDRNATSELVTVVLNASHGTMVKTEAKAATCTEDGNKEYYTCSVCEKNFTDAVGNIEIKDIVIKAKGHEMTKKASTAASCTGSGNVEYYHCNTCTNNYSDVEGKYALISIETNATGHKLSEVKAKNATCTTAGNIKYYHCDACGDNFQDRQGTMLIEEDEVIVIPATGHGKISQGTMTKIEAKSETCTTAGNVEYYTCNNCYTHFEDASATKVLASVVIPSAHKLSKVEGKDPTEEANGVATHYTCSECNNKFADEKGNKIATSVELPRLVKVKSEPIVTVPDNMSEDFRAVEELTDEILKHTEEELIVSEDGKIESVHFEFTLDSEDDMPEDKEITIQWKYSDIAAGVGKDTDFIVAHMYKAYVGGTEVVEVEFPEVFKDNDGIWFVVHGLSPISVSWVETETPAPENPAPPSGDSNPGSSDSEDNEKDEELKDEESNSPVYVETVIAEKPTASQKPVKPSNKEVEKIEEETPVTEEEETGEQEVVEEAETVVPEASEEETGNEIENDSTSFPVVPVIMAAAVVAVAVGAVILGKKRKDS